MFFLFNIVKLIILLFSSIKINGIFEVMIFVFLYFLFSFLISLLNFVLLCLKWYSLIWFFNWIYKFDGVIIGLILFDLYNFVYMFVRWLLLFFKDGVLKYMIDIWLILFVIEYRFLLIFKKLFFKWLIKI